MPSHELSEVTEESLLRQEVNCGTLQFADLCAKLGKIEKLRTTNEKMAIIFNKKLAEHLNKQSIFPLLRLLIPVNDNTRKKYGLKQAAVASTYIEALHLNPSSADAQRLKFWKNPSKLSTDIANKTSGELGEVLQDVLKTRISVERSEFTILDVNNILDELAATSGDKQTAVIRKKILNVFSPLEQKWLMRIVFQDMKIGLKYENVLKWLNPNALQRYNECTDLRQLCYELSQGLLSSSSAEDGNVLSRGISLFTCFQPMLAKGFTNSGQINEVENAMKKHPFVMDLKLDGERMLCHIKKEKGSEGSKGVFWSRNGNDYSTTYRSLLDDIIEHIHCEACVLDGEVCAWDDSTQRFIPFGHNRTVARYEQDSQRENPQSGGANNGSSMRLVYILFDILYLEGLRDNSGRLMERSQWWNIIDFEKTIPGGINALQAEDAKEACRTAHLRNTQSMNSSDLLHLPLLARRALLTQAVQLIPNRIQLVRCQSVYTSNIVERKRQLEAFFNQVSSEGEEGLVVKDLLSPYCLGVKSRQTMHWVKMKPEYSDMTRDLDLIILGAYYGEGRSMRGKGLSTFLCGVKDSSQDMIDSSSSKLDECSQSSVQYKSICKVGTGYSFTALEELRRKLIPHAQPWNKNNRQYLPPHFCPWRIGKVEDIPDVWIPPEHSIIIELKCAELVTSTQFSAGITCRFPRLRKIRYDKDVSEVMTMADVKKVIERPRMNIAEAASRGVTANKRKKKAPVKVGTGLFHHSGDIVSSQFLLPKTTANQEMVSVVFQGKVFCIIEGSFTLPASALQERNGSDSFFLQYVTKGNRKLSRVQVIEIVQRHGGEVVANPVPNCFVIVGDKRTMQIKSLIDAGKNDVLSFDYIIDGVNHALGNEDGNPCPSHFLGFTPETKSVFGGMFDEFGDSFTEHVGESQLRAIVGRIEEVVNSIKRKHDTALTTKKAKARKTKSGAESTQVDASAQESLALFDTLKGKNWRDIICHNTFEDSDVAPLLDSCRWNIFWRSSFVLYMDIFDELLPLSAKNSVFSREATSVDLFKRDNSISLFRSNKPVCTSGSNVTSTRLRALVPELLLRGATISPVLNQAVTHVVVDFEVNYSSQHEEKLLGRLRDLRLQNDYVFEKRVVSLEWIKECLSRGELLQPDQAHIIQLRNTCASRVS